MPARARAGNTKTAILCCITPAASYREESRSTLQFAARAKSIRTTASANEMLDDQAMIVRLRREIKQLRRKLKRGSEAEAAEAAEVVQRMRKEVERAEEEKKELARDAESVRSKVGWRGRVRMCVCKRECACECACVCVCVCACAC